MRMKRQISRRAKGILLALAVAFAGVVGMGCRQWHEPELKAEAEKDPLACAELAARAIRDDHSRARLLVWIAEAYAESGRKKKVPALLSEALRTQTEDKENPSPYPITEIASVYAKAGQKEKALKLLSRAHAVAGAIKRTSDRDSHLWVIGITYVEMGEYEAVLRIVDEITDFSDKCRVLATTARRIAETGQKEKALELTETAFRWGQKIRRGPMSKYAALGRVGQSYAALGKYDEAFSAVTMIRWPSIRCGAFVDLGRTLGQCGQRSKALDALHEALVIAEGIPNRRDRVREQIDIARGFLEIDEKNLASETLSRTASFARMTDDAREKAIVLAEIAPLYGEIGDANTASALLSEALETAESIEDHSDRDLPLWRIAKGLAEVGQAERAIELAERTGSSETLFRVATACAGRGEYMHALQTIRMMTDPFSNMLKGLSLIKIGTGLGKSKQKLGDKEKEILRNIANEIQQEPTAEEMAREIQIRDLIERGMRRF